LKQTKSGSGWRSPFASVGFYQGGDQTKNHQFAQHRISNSLTGLIIFEFVATFENMDNSDSEAENYVVVQDSSLKNKLPKKKRGKIQGKPLVSVDSSDSEGEHDKVQKFSIVHDFPVNETHNEYVADEVDPRKQKKNMAHYLWSKEEVCFLIQILCLSFYDFFTRI
jgi:hypothetical protein